MNRYKYLVIHSDGIQISVYPTAKKDEAMDYMRRMAIIYANNKDDIEIDENTYEARVYNSSDAVTHLWRIIDAEYIIEERK